MTENIQQNKTNKIIREIIMIDIDYIRFIKNLMLGFKVNSKN
jgi:hypothetical protein